MRLAVLRGHRGHLGLVFRPSALPQLVLVGQGVLDAVTAVHELQLHFGRQTELQQELKLKALLVAQESRHFDLGTALERIDLLERIEMI